jgi:serine/threonine-protein kinase
MDGESDLLDKLAQSVADGASINWDEVDALPADAELRRLLKLLRVVSDVAEVHRSPADEVPPSADEDTTELIVRPPPVPGLHPPGGGLGQWGHLLLLKKIGEGSFGEVYHAHDTWLDHPVALKLFKPKAADRDLSTRILHEARKLARVRHPNVVSVHGADSHNGQVGFWMDLIEGRTLEALVLAGRLSAGEATYIGQEVCRALAAVHQAKIIHRDVKAQNVMRAYDGGRIILMDFGAGEFIDEASLRSRGQGTPLYIAPEMFAGADASVQSDIYAVGVLLHYLVSGGFPVRASSLPELIGAHQRGERRHLRDGRPDLPDSFVAVVERAIDPDPARRFATAGEMDAALVGALTKGVGPIDIQKLKERPEERTILQNVGRVVLLITGVLAGTEVLGFLASRAFEIILRIEPEFTAGPLRHLDVGWEVLVPFIAYWVFAGAVLGALAGARLLAGSQIDAIQTRWTGWFGRPDPVTVATIVFLLGAAGWTIITWAFFDLFVALDAVRAPSRTPIDLSILSPASHSVHRAHGTYSAYLSFALGFAAIRWFPRLERSAKDPSAVRLLKWATVVVAFATIAAAAFPRRLVWDSFDLVVFENRPALVIGRSGEELLLYDPGTAERSHSRVRADAPGLERTGQTRKLFDPWPPR